MDIAPELLKKIQADFQSNFDKSKVISGLYAKVRDGTAAYSEANNFAIEVGRILADAYQNNLSSDILPDGRMYYNIAQRIINPTMYNNYQLITGVTSNVQRSLNEAAGLGIQPVTPQINQDRINGIINRVSEEEAFDNVAWILAEPVVNFSQSIVDDAIRENVKFHADAGLQPRIVRKLMGGCCEWCRAVAGTYTYPDVPKDVYRRHQRCRCTVDYHPGDGKVQNVHSKIWSKARIAEDTIEYMGQANIYETNIGGKKYAIKAYKNDNYDNVWCQTYSGQSQQMCEYLDKEINQSGRYGKVERIIVAKNQTLRGIAAYDHTTNALFISEELIDEVKFKQIVDTQFFAAQNLQDIVIHELGGHKVHWDAVYRYYEDNKLRFKDIETAKNEFESKLRKYIKEQRNNNFNYLLEKVSENAHTQFLYDNRLHETIADVKILIEKEQMQDVYLKGIVEEVLSYDGNAK